MSLVPSLTQVEDEANERKGRVKETNHFFSSVDWESNG